MNSSTAKKYARIVIGAVMAGGGILHFTNADLFKGWMPDSLTPHADLFNVTTGLLQIVMGVAFWVPRFRSFARWSTIALLVVTLPPAVNQIFHPPAHSLIDLSPAAYAGRVVVQLLMICLTWWCTAPEKSPRAA